MLYTTFRLAREHHACKSRYDQFAALKGGVAAFGDDTSIPLDEIVETMGKVYREFRPEDIRRLRGEMTQKQFAEFLGVSVYAVSSWEEGTRRPNLVSYHKLLDMEERLKRGGLNV